MLCTSSMIKLTQEVVLGLADVHPVAGQREGKQLAIRRDVGEHLGGGVRGLVSLQGFISHGVGPSACKFSVHAQLRKRVSPPS